MRRNIGLVFQDTTLDGYLTAEQNLRLHAELYGMARDAVAERLQQVMEMVGLWERRSSLVGTFSGGMKRRLEIARGLLALAAGAVPGRADGRASTRRRAARSGATSASSRRAEDITIFLTTHYMDEAEYCDRIAIIDRGKIVALDTPEALKASVGKDRVQIKTADDEAAIAALRERFGIEAVIAEGGGHVRRVRGRAVRPAPVRRARPADPLGERLAPVARRRVHVLHRHHDPRRGGGAG